MNLKHRYSRASLTKIGWFFIVLVFLVSGVALNSGNNLIYLTLSTLTSYFLFSGFLSIANTYSTNVSVKFPYSIFANAEAKFLINVSNNSKSSKFLINIEHRYFQEEFSYLKPFSSVERSVRHKFEKRGSYSVNDVFVKSLYPFSFFKRKTILTITDGDFLVFPEIHSVKIKGIDNFGFEISLPFRGENEELFSIRDYKEGEDKRKIAWKLTAKTGEEKVVDGTRDSSRTLVFFIDDARIAYSDNDEFEKAVSLIASAIYNAFEKGINFSLITPKEEFEEEYSLRNLFLSLDYLARLEWVDSVPSTRPKGALTYGDVEII
jgi:uncharacterized protein (DUF58 family)